MCMQSHIPILCAAHLVFSPIESLTEHFDHSKTLQYTPIPMHCIIDLSPMAPWEGLSQCNRMTATQLYINPIRFRAHPTRPLSLQCCRQLSTTSDNFPHLFSSSVKMAVALAYFPCTSGFPFQGLDALTCLGGFSASHPSGASTLAVYRSTSSQLPDFAYQDRKKERRRKTITHAIPDFFDFLPSRNPINQFTHTSLNRSRAFSPPGNLNTMKNITPRIL